MTEKNSTGLRNKERRQSGSSDRRQKAIRIKPCQTACSKFCSGLSWWQSACVEVTLCTKQHAEWASLLITPVHANISEKKKEHESILERRFRAREKTREYLVATKAQDESSSTCQTNCWNCDKLMIKYTAEVYSGVSESSSHQNLRFTQRERERMKRVEVRLTSKPWHFATNFLWLQRKRRVTVTILNNQSERVYTVTCLTFEVVLVPHA